MSNRPLILGCVATGLVLQAMGVWALARSRRSDDPVDVEPAIGWVGAYFDPMIGRPFWLPAMVMPIGGGAVPTNPNLLPGALRPYRGGVHEGVDLRCTPGTPVRAAAGGFVLAVDDRLDLPPDRRSALLRHCQVLRRTPHLVLNVLHGRRVTLSHGTFGGRLVTTSYSHLGRIREDLVPGAEVGAGEIIGWAGSSGTSHAYARDGWGELHFEIRTDGRPLGEGLAPREAGALYATILEEEGE